MYDKIGKKIKTLTKVVSFILVLLSVISGIILLCVGIIEEDAEYLILGLACLIVMPFLIWFSSFTMYGFGELIDKVCDIERNTRGNNPIFEVEQKEVIENKENDKVQKLKKLRDQGLLTEEEYNEFISKTE